MENGQTYSIAELSDEFGVTHRAIRFYEDKGLLQPGRHGRNRVYSEQDRVRLSLILRGKRVGFSLDEIGELLDLQKIEDRDEQLRLSKQRFLKRIEVLRNQTVDIEQAIAHLEKACEVIDKRLEDNARRAEEKRASDASGEFAVSSTGYGGPITRPLEKW